MENRSPVRNFFYVVFSGIRWFFATIGKYLGPAMQRVGKATRIFLRWFDGFFPQGSLMDRLIRNRMYQYLLFPAAMLYFEFLLRIFTKTPLFQTAFYPIVFAISFGFLLSAILSLFPARLRYIIGVILMAVIAFYFGLEVVLHNTYQMYMTLSAVFTEAGNVTGNYGSDVANAVKGAVPVIILYYIPFILQLLFMFAYRPIKRRRARYTITMLLLWFLIGCFGVLFASHMPSARQKYAAQFSFDSANDTFGLIEGTYLNTKYSLFGNRKAEAFTLTPAQEQAQDAAGTAKTAADESGETADEGSADAVDYGYNEMDIDFDTRIAEDNNEDIKAIDEYVNSLEPSAKNEYTGLFEGKNLITIAAESFALQVIDEELTPTLYRLANEGIKFTDFYQPAWGGSTSTGEFSILTGLVPVDDVNSMLETVDDNMYFTTGNQCLRLGYTSLAFHNGEYDYYDRDLTHPNLGYTQFLGWGNGLEDLLPRWSEDEDTFRETMNLYIDEQPFNVYYMTGSAHFPYEADYHLVEENLPRVKEVMGDKYSDEVLYYFCYQMELENALTTMVNTLEEKGIADDTVIVLCPDHYPYGLAKSATFGNSEDYLLDLYKVDSYDGFVRDKTSLIIWSGSIEGMGLEVDTPVYSLDILPTLSNLFGFEYDSRLLVGRDVFSDEEPLCIWSDYSFLTEKGWYNAATGEFLPTTDEEVTEEYLDEVKTTVANKIAFSSSVVKYDYYGVLFGDGEDSG